VNGVLAIRGDLVRLTITTNDDGAASVRVLADVDGNVMTTGDQTLLYGPVTDANGAPLVVALPTLSLSPGRYSIFVTADDGVNPVATALYAPPFVVMAGRASVAPNRSATYGVLGSQLVIAVGETENGNVVLNGDSDVGDGVIGSLDAQTGVYTQTAVSTDVTGVDGAGTARVLEPGTGYSYFTTREQDQGLINGDGDATDVMTSYLPVSGPPIFTHAFGGVSPLSPAQRFGPRIVVSLVEAQEGVGGTNQNPSAGDADALDTVAALFEGGSNTLIRFPFAAQTPFAFKSNGGVGAYLASEANQGSDLNADADLGDTILVLPNLASVGPIGLLLGRSGLTGGHGARHLQPGAAYAVSGDQRTVTYVSEPAVATTLNGDADATDFVPSVYDATTLTEFFPGPGNLNGGNNARFAFYEGTKAFYTAIEDPLHSPLVAGDNGDGDLLDQEILYWTDHAVNAAAANRLVPTPANFAAFPTLTGLALDAGSLVELTPGWLSAVVSEAANGNLDLSGEGTIGNALLLIDATTSPPTVWNTGFAPSATPSPGTIPITGVADAGGVVINVLEAQNGNLNNAIGGDMDATDQLLFYLPFASPLSPVNLGNTSAVHVKVLGGRVAITANENVAGSTQDYNADGDTFDFVFRVVSTAGVVEEPGLTCAPTSRPATDGGTLWAFLRSESAEARDLNADGDQFDFVVGAYRP
jgi:hypothetical protein